MTPTEALAAALTEVQGGAVASWLGRAPLILAALDGYELVPKGSQLSTDYQRGYADGFDAPTNVSARNYAAAPAEGLEPCAYCGSVDGLTPPTVSLSDPMTGETLRRLIDEVTGGLSDPRLHEVDWEAVAALAGSVDPAPGDQEVSEYVLEMMLEFQRMYGQLRKVPTEAVRMVLVKAATGRFAALAQPAAPAEGLDVAERRRLAGALANWALSPGESFRTLLPYLGLAYAEAYREGWMVFTNAINERLTRAEDAPAEGPDTERLARALCRHSEYVWSNEPEWQREEWRGKARKLLRVLCDIDRELAALEANHE